MAGELTTRAGVKRAAGIEDSNTNSDGWIDAAIPAASRAFKEWTGRGVELLIGSRVDTFSGTGAHLRTLPHYPVWSITSVKINDDVITQRPDTLSAGWVLVRDTVFLQGYRFTRGIANCEIQFSAGYDTSLNPPDPKALPEDIDRAVAELVAWKLREKDRVGQQSKTVGNETVVFKLADAPDSVKTVVATHRRTG